VRVHLLLFLIWISCRTPPKNVYPAYTEDYTKSLLEAYLKSPDNVELIRRIAVVYREQKQYEKAEIYFDKAIEKASNYCVAYVGRAKNRLLQNNLEGAWSDCQKARTLYFYDIFGQLEYTEGLILLKKNELKEASKKFQSAEWKSDIDVEPLFFYHYALLHYRMLSPNKALHKINAYLARFPQSCDALYLRMTILNSLYKFKNVKLDSISILKNCSQTHPVDSILLISPLK